MSNPSCLLFLAFSLFTPSLFANEVFGKFAQVKGNVYIITNDTKVLAKVRSDVFQGSTIEASANSRAKIIMSSDRSVIHISPDSSVKIASYTGSGNKKNVEMQLSHGKIRSEVKGTYGEKNKFLIKTPTAVAGVRGTDFLVNHNLQTNITEVTTLKGAVELTALKNGVPTGAPIMIRQDQKSSVSANKPVEPPTVIPQAEKNQIDTDSKNIEAPSAPAPTSGSSSQNSNESAPSLPVNADSGKKRIGDTKDLAPENYDKVPTQPGTPATPPVVAQPTRPLPPPPNPRLNDAIRDKTDKTKVKIIPQAQ